MMMLIGLILVVISAIALVVMDVRWSIKRVVQYNLALSSGKSSLLSGSYKERGATVIASGNPFMQDLYGSTVSGASLDEIPVGETSHAVVTPGVTTSPVGVNPTPTPVVSRPTVSEPTASTPDPVPDEFGATGVFLDPDSPDADTTQDLTPVESSSSLSVSATVLFLEQ